MVRLYGRCARGERLVGHVPQGHWKTITFVAALRRHGMRASQTIDGSMTGKKFLAYVEQCLAPTLKRKDIVMIDNLPAHKAAGVREAIEARGATLRYLPKYSPDLNPIEMPFSKLKADLRKAAERTIPRLRRRIGRFAAHPHCPRSRQLFQACRLRVKSDRNLLSAALLDILEAPPRERRTGVYKRLSRVLDARASLDPDQMS